MNHVDKVKLSQQPGGRASRALLVALVLLVSGAFVVVGCDPTPGSKEPGQEVATPQEPVVDRSSADAAPDKSPPEPTSDVADAAPPEPAPEPQPETTPEPTPEPTPPDYGPPLPAGPLAIKEWFVATVPASAQSDPVRPALENGSFRTPTFAGRFYSFIWSRRAPDDKGKIGSVTGRYGYAAVTIKSPGWTRVIARADRAFTIFHNGALLRLRQPGDVYGSGKIRIPLLLQPGENVVVMQLRTGNPTLALEVTKDPIAFNTADSTMPEYRVGNKDEQCVGIPILNLMRTPITDVTAKVKANEHFAEATFKYTALPAGAVTQVPFQLKPKKAFGAEGTEIKFTVEISSPSLTKPYEKEVTFKVAKAEGAYRVTRISKMDGSCQFFGVLAPKDFDPKKKYGLILSLHGAGVNARGQARAYSQKDWAYVVAPTNRRPFGFDWEQFGQRDGLEALAHAKQIYSIDPTKVYVTGHSMGGHGTWQFSVLFPGLFAVAAPSAGWSSFYSYTGRTRPTGVFARSQAASDTNNYISNLADRGVYIIHGSADNNVPVREGRDMYKLVQTVKKDVKYFEQPGAGHWWNDKSTPGTDCVDLPDMMAFVKSHTLDPNALEFSFKTPGPWVSASRSFATILSTNTPLKDASITSAKKDKELTLTTENVRSMQLDGAVLQAAGITSVTIDGKATPVQAGTMQIGPKDGKRPGVHGPFNEVLYRPFCMVYDEKGPETNKAYAAFLASNWSVIGNGKTCAIGLSQLTEDIKKAHNILYIGLQPSQIAGAKLPFSWTDKEIKVDKSTYNNAAIFMTYPVDGKLAGFIYATKGAEYLLYRIQPFTSSLSLPDYFVLGTQGGRTAGFFDATWAYNAAYRNGQ